MALIVEKYNQGSYSLTYLKKPVIVMMKIAYSCVST